MGKRNKKNVGSIRRWQNKKTQSQNRKKKLIKKAKNEALNSIDLLSLSENLPHFLGVFSADEISNLGFKSFPLSFIVNLAPKSHCGFHWLAIWIDQFNVEIFDSFGFLPTFWDFFPTHLLKFLNRFDLTHEIRISPVCQSPSSHNCGLFSLYFIHKRPLWSFEKCCAKISSVSFTRSFRKACFYILK